MRAKPRGEAELAGGVSWGCHPGRGGHGQRELALHSRTLCTLLDGLECFQWGQFYGGMALEPCPSALTLDK